ncbi:HD domain-containing protein [Thermoanaerobacterium butyriciformans]|uniref:HD superfamily phosphohydrolase n=1 Tax=Thermoanaerobacterium butyriciformans TaxID=1702242 RepID=A0ABS4NBZ5_9THEO|nr:HD domain-containing protein [Thermoanaerobacterium butyriciformans]MBP2070714.1 HD superfamily phosphohydrolase [Thermoanaerobacterium butyriciformans]
MKKYFRDPIYNFIIISENWILDLINSKEFQRLKQVKQLGTSEVTYYGANHTRFSHSIGTMYLMDKALAQLKNVINIDEETRKIGLAAALLHDIGHGPFSHVFEKVMSTNHEQWTIDIILGDTEVNRILRAVNIDFPQKVAEVIKKEYEHKFVSYLLSSQLDVDRMDYLLRDSYYVGVKYGLFDVDMIIKSMLVCDDNIVIDYKGLYAVEQYVLARHYMYWQVYYHKTTRGYELLLQNILKRAKYLYEQNLLDIKIDLLIPVFKNEKINVEEYIQLNDSVILYAILSWKNSRDKILRDLCCKYLYRDLYKAYEIEQSFPFSLDAIKEILKNQNMDADYYLALDRPSNVIYDYYVEGEEGEKPPILINSMGKNKSITRFSESIKAISGSQKIKYYLYFPRYNYEGVNISDDIIKYLEELKNE